MMRILIVATALFFLVLSSGCSLVTEQVPVGYIGMKQSPAGLDGEILTPGYYQIFGRDKLLLIATNEVSRKEKLNILCSDDMNLKLDLKIRARVDVKDALAVKSLLDRQGAKLRWEGNIGFLDFKTLYITYIKDIARSVARGVVSKYATTQVSAAREEIQKSILTSLVSSLKGTPVEIRMAVTSNIDYPEVITRAMEAKKEMEIEIGQEKAKQAVELLRMENRKKMASIKKIVIAMEAEAEAAKYSIIGERLTDKFLTLKTIEANMLLYGNVGAGDKVFFLPAGMDSMPPVLIQR
mgnify:CR=1 FL=1